MMKKILKFFMYIALFIGSLIVFLPKESLYNFAEKELEKYQIIVSNELRDEKIFALNVSNADLYFEGINIGKLEEATFCSYFVYTKVNLEELSLMSSFSVFLPSPISNITLKHSILNFNKVFIYSSGAFGELNAQFDIFTKILKVELNASKNMKDSYFKSLSYMKLENGVYTYEYKL
jgi:hypothetical protein